MIRALSIVLALLAWIQFRPSESYATWVLTPDQPVQPSNVLRVIFPKYDHVVLNRHFFFATLTDSLNKHAQNYPNYDSVTDSYFLEFKNLKKGKYELSLMSHFGYKNTQKIDIEDSFEFVIYTAIPKYKLTVDQALFEQRMKKSSTLNLSIQQSGCFSSYSNYFNSDDGIRNGNMQTFQRNHPQFHDSAISLRKSAIDSLIPLYREQRKKFNSQYTKFKNGDSIITVEMCYSTSNIELYANFGDSTFFKLSSSNYSCDSKGSDEFWSFCAQLFPD